jgi:hypothetical protein
MRECGERMAQNGDSPQQWGLAGDCVQGVVDFVRKNNALRALNGAQERTIIKEEKQSLSRKVGQSDRMRLLGFC